MDANTLAATIVTGIVSVILAVINKDRKDAGKTPITTEDRITAGGGDMAYLLSLAQRAEQRANEASQEATMAREEAARATARAARAEDRAAALEERETRLTNTIAVLTAWARRIISDWTVIRLQEEPPDLPDIDT